MTAWLSSSSWRLAPFDKARYQGDSRLRAFLQTSAARALALTIACWIVAFIFCQYEFWRDPHSTFFDESLVFQTKYTAVRQAEAKELIDAAEKQSGDSHTASTSPIICAGIISVKRKEIQYLNETVGSILVGLTDVERSALSLQVLFADIDSSVHPDYDNEWLKLLDYWLGYHVSDEQLEKLREYKEEDKVRPKALFDYVYMLEQCYNKTTAPYIAIFEDDLIFADSWLIKTLNALAEIRESNKAWLYLRLFWTDVMLGWDKDIDPWYTNPILNYILALALTFAISLGLQKRLKRSHTRENMAVFNVITFVTIPAFITLIYMVGWNSLWPLDGVRRMDVKGCCTQALVYDRSQVRSLVDRLQQVHPDQTDLIIEEYANEKGLSRYALAPQLVQHVGLVSSRGTLKKDSRTNWAFYFEGFSARKLRKQHDKLVDEGLKDLRPDLDDLQQI